MKKKYQIITMLTMAVLTACGTNSEEHSSSELQENRETNTQEQVSTQIQHVSEIQIFDTLAVADRVVSEIDTLAAVMHEEIDANAHITDQQADEIIKTLHSDNNNATSQIENAQQETATPVSNVVSPPKGTEEGVEGVEGAQEPASSVDAKDEVADLKIKIEHLKWDVLVRKNVSSSGKVNYKAFKTDQAQLQQYLDQLAKQKPASDWTRNEKLAYWINAYNAFTVKLIIDNYPTSSITKLKGGKPWDDKFITLEGTTYSLGQIENDILRKMNEPRIHFAINCASGSCPNLLNRAFMGGKMASQLKKVTQSFLNDSSKNDFSGKKIKISELFNWYAKDFNGGDIIGFLNHYRTSQLDANTKIEFLPYDWSLNE